MLKIEGDRISLRYPADVWPAAISRKDRGKSFIRDNYYDPSDYIKYIALTYGKTNLSDKKPKKSSRPNRKELSQPKEKTQTKDKTKKENVVTFPHLNKKTSRGFFDTMLDSMRKSLKEMDDATKKFNK